MDAQGFDAGEREIPAAPVALDDATRDRMARILSAAIHGATPEEIADYLDDGFPEDVDAALGRPGERLEMDAHLDLLLAVEHGAVEV